MNKQEFIEGVAAKVQVSTSESAKLVAGVLDVLTETLVKGEEIAIKGFGTFKVKDTAEKQGRNPKTGESITIPAGKKISFAVSPKVKESLK